MVVKNKEYNILVSDILNHSEFSKLKDISHHGLNRYDHSIRVSYVSYLFSKILFLDRKKVTRGALLHDFFFEDNSNFNRNEKIYNIKNHPKEAVKNADKYFEISLLEKDIIETHMFPISPKVPKYLESWLVDFVDDIVSLYEKGYSVRKELSAATMFLMVFAGNYLR